jgi:hypothetical protein
MKTKNATTVSKPWGVAGEEHKIVVAPIFKGGPKELSPEHLGGKPGLYKVQLLMSRPGFLVAGEREHKFIDDIVGSSHMVVARPARSRTAQDVHRVVLQAHSDGRWLEFTGLPNEQGHLGKFVADKVLAASSANAESIAYKALAPFLSAWSVHLDIPMHVETIQVTDLQTHVSTLRVRTPQFEVIVGSGISPVLSSDFCKYASVYREALNSNSPFYRFLCLYKLLESIVARRSEAARIARTKGQEVKKFNETVPKDRDALVEILRTVYPWRTNWSDDLAIQQIVPFEAYGKRLGFLKEKYLEPIRNSIAHSLLRNGEIKAPADQLETIQEVNKWLSFCRIWVRLLLRNEFPVEFAFQMNPAGS